MTSQFNRREIVVGAAALVWGAAAIAGDAGKASGATDDRGRGAAKQLAELEKREGGRLGVAALDTATGLRFQHRGEERFALCSTFKFLAAAAILRRVDRGTEHLDRSMKFSPGDLLEYAPISKQHVEEGAMSLEDACAAAVQWSDNTAANLMLNVLGGPRGVTAFVRSLGDNVTRLDRTEPALNIVPPGEVRDTTTPSSMVGLLNSIVLENVLSHESRTRLQGWMLDAKVGEHRLPAGLPTGWRIAHKTGTWSNQANDVGVIWPPDRGPIIVAALYVRDGTRPEQREGVLREAGRIVATSF
jgi:beta-lactamase class A